MILSILRYKKENTAVYAILPINVPKLSFWYHPKHTASPSQGKTKTFYEKLAENDVLPTAISTRKCKHPAVTIPAKMAQTGETTPASLSHFFAF